MSNNITPTAKQRAVVRILVEDGGNPKSFSKAMLQAGYSPAMAKTPKKLTGSRGYQIALSETGISDYQIAQVLSDGLDATRGGSDIPDHAMRLRTAEIILRIKGLM